MEPLSAVAARALGALIEKQITTPDNYPLTLNALTAACNQTSNREPVMQLDEATVLSGLDELARHNLGRAVQRSDSRVKRYRHLMVDTLHLHEGEIAIMCVLLLRGAQTTGEIRTRTARMHDFNDLAQVEIALQSLMSLAPPLVTQLPRRPGQKEVRYAHLMSGEAVDNSELVAETVEPARVSRIDALEQEVAALRAEVAELRNQVDEFRRAFS